MAMTTQQEISAAGTAAGGLMSAYGAYEGGIAQQKAANYTAAQMRTAAGQAQAAGTIAAGEQIRQSQMLQSHAIAVAAASGAGALDPTVVGLVSKMSSYGLYNAQMEQYNANEKAAGMQDEANAKEYEGKLAAQAGRTKAVGSILSTAFSVAAMAAL